MLKMSVHQLPQYYQPQRVPSTTKIDQFRIQAQNLEYMTQMELKENRLLLVRKYNYIRCKACLILLEI